MITPHDVEFAKERVRQELQNLFPNQAGDVEDLVEALEFWMNTSVALSGPKGS